MTELQLTQPLALSQRNEKHAYTTLVRPKLEYANEGTHISKRTSYSVHFLFSRQFYFASWGRSDFATPYFRNFFKFVETASLYFTLSLYDLSLRHFILLL